MVKGTLKKWNVRFLGLPPSTGQKEALQWLMFARLGILYSLTVLLVLQQIWRRESIAEFPLLLGYGLLAGSFAFNLFFSVVLERLPAHWGMAAVQVLFDVVITSVWLQFSGGKETLFGLLYLIQILVVALILYQRAAVYTAIVASFFFGSVIGAASDSSLTLVWGVYSVLFLTIGLVGGYLSEELLRTSESLKEKSRKMEKLMELHERIIAGIPTGLLTVDHELKVYFINPAGEAILNRKASEAVGRPLAEVEPGLLPFFTQIDSRDIPEDQSEPGVNVMDQSALSATGTDHHVSFFVRPKTDKGGSVRLQQRVEVGAGNYRRVLRGDVAELDPDAGIGGLLDAKSSGGRVLLFQDVTKLVHLEERLRQNEKLAAVGQLAAGIAHEIRNPLASMSASIQMLKSSLPAQLIQEENERLMDIAIREIDRLNRLISEFLGFVKPEKFSFETVDLDVLMKEVLSAAKGQATAQKVDWNDAVNAAVRVRGNTEKLKQVLWNLVVNAIQAMPQGGRLELGCRYENAQYAQLWVADTGIGMDEEVLSHLYEPFFTTKDRGTGLGLATAYKIIEAHHGEIRVKSQPSQGTRFEIWIPRSG